MAPGYGRRRLPDLHTEPLHIFPANRGNVALTRFCGQGHLCDFKSCADSESYGDGEPAVAVTDCPVECMFSTPLICCFKRRRHGARHRIRGLRPDSTPW